MTRKYDSIPSTVVSHWRWCDFPRTVGTHIRPSLSFSRIQSSDLPSSRESPAALPEHQPEPESVMLRSLGQSSGRKPPYHQNLGGFMAVSEDETGCSLVAGDDRFSAIVVQAERVRV